MRRPRFILGSEERFALFAGVALIFVSLFLAAQTRSFLKRAEMTQGVVASVRTEKSTDSDGFDTTTYFPTIHFDDPLGQRYVLEGDGHWVGTKQSYRKGERLGVFYDPQDPTNARTADPSSFVFGPTLCWLFGFMLVAGVLAHTRAQRPVRASALQVDVERRALLEKELARKERVLWVGRPLPHEHARASAGGYVALAVWGAGGLVWPVAAALTVLCFGMKVGWAWALLPPALALFGAPAVIFLRAPFRARSRAFHTLYAVTNRRVLKLEALRSSRRLWSASLGSFASPSCSLSTAVNPGGHSGDITFERPEDGDCRHGFFGIQEHSHVAALMKSLIARRQRRAQREAELLAG